MASRELFFVRSSFCENDGGHFFSGLAFVKNSVVIGKEGFCEYLEENEFNAEEFVEGRFSLFFDSGGYAFCKTDAAGQDVIYYYLEGGEWAVSNSFYLLLKHLKENSAPLSFNCKAARACLVEHSSAAQLLSNHTLVNEIRVLPLGFDIRINLDGIPNGFELIKRSVGPADEKGMSSGDYKELLSDYVIDAASRTRALLSRYKDRSVIDITGGVDSRVVLAFVLMAVDDLSGLNFCSNRHREDDYAVAKKLAGEFGFDVKNNQVRRDTVASREAYEIWKHGNLGVYFPVYMPNGGKAQSVLRLHGAGGECYRPFYGKSAVEITGIIDKKYSSKISTGYCRALMESLQEAGVSAVDKSSMLWHYYNFRSRFHFGRNSFQVSNYLFFTPFSCSRLYNISRLLSAKEISQNQLAFDILYSIDGRLVSVPFDEDNKSFDVSCWKRSVFHPGELSEAKVKDYTIYPRHQNLEGAFEAQGQSKEEVVRRFEKELLRYKDLLVSSGYCTESYFDKSLSQIDASSFTKSLKNASKLISLGAVLEACC